MSDGLNHDDTRKILRLGSLFAGVIALIPGALMLTDAARPCALPNSIMVTPV